MDRFDEFSRRLDNIIDGARKNLNFVQKHKVKGMMKQEFYAGMLYAYKNIKEITKELRGYGSQDKETE
jgi:hypothetical protein